MKHVFLLLLLLSSFFLWSHPVLAHKLKVDGDVGVTVHITPNDEPIAGKESEIFVDLHDPTGTFDPTKPGTCDCRLTITTAAGTSTELPIVVDGAYAKLLYVFPTSAVYTLTVDGKPSAEAGALFSAFRVSLDVFVQQDPNAPPSQMQPRPWWIWGMVAGAVLTAGLILFVRPHRKRA